MRRHFLDAITADELQDVNGDDIEPEGEGEEPTDDDDEEDENDDEGEDLDGL